jgi:enamine deaminase RidA (YjgF/YER057c/UK114 family)
MTTSTVPATARRFVGPLADDLTVLCLPGGPSTETAPGVEAPWRDLVRQLAQHGASLHDVTTETLLVRDIARTLPALLAARRRVLAELGQLDVAPRPSFIGQAPAGDDRPFHLVATALVPHRRDAWAVEDVAGLPGCGCEGCAQTGARIVRIGGRTVLHSTNLYGRGPDAYTQTLDAFRAAEALLRRHDLAFRDVVRTWIHLRDIDRDYAALNRARREFFQEQGIGQRPASTGVQGIPFPDGHLVSLRLTAMRPADATVISTPTLNEAWSYGADFSRGLRLVDPNQVTLLVSGTASIDEAGRTVHQGDVVAQAERMLHNIETLLAGQGASFADVASAITYLKHPADADAVRAVFARRKFEGFPCSIVDAPLCRPDLLCETEAVCVLSVPPPTA